MRIRIAIIWILLIAVAGGASAQSGTATGTGTLRGQVKDPSGAVIKGATVLVTPATGQPVSVQTNGQGMYVVKGLAPGTYKVEVIATGFGLFEKDNVAVKALQIAEADASLQIQTSQQQVTVSAEAPTLDVNPANNAGAIVISGKELEALSDDPDELQSDLEALAGPSAGPNGGQMYIDGFTAGQLPPKSAIREIRINSNPFSTEYDKLGYGRIEIFTKPGSDQFHGQAMLQGNDSSFNSMNPFAVTEPAYDNVMFNGSLSGPISKNASFFISGQRRDINNVDVLDACVLSNDPNPQLFGATRPITPFAPATPSAGSQGNCGAAGWTPFTDSVPNPRTRTNVSPRVDYQLSKNNTLSMRYQYWRDNQQNILGSAEDVPTQGTNTLETEQTVQLDDSQVISTSVVNDTRFQFLHDVTNQTPTSTLPTVDVPGAFNAGGSNEQTILDTANHYELQNNTQMVTKNHTFNFGGRLRWTTDNSSANSDFSGMFNFDGESKYQITEQNIAAGLPANANGGGANQFAITLGTPEASLSYADLALYFQDDWRVRPNLTISPGLRLETQTGISDHADLAPRIALAWGIGGGKGGPKWVIRAGSGIFYDRFAEDLLMQATRLNGVTQEQYVVPSPSCFFATTPAMPVTLNQIESECGNAQPVLPTIYRLAPTIHAPGTLQTAVSVERQLTKIATLAVTYINSRGWDQLLTNNVNTPLPGTYNPEDPATAVYPSGNPGNIYQYESEGVFRQNQLMTNLTIRAGANLTLFGYYALNYANSDTAGASSFPSNPYNISEDYGRAAFDVRDRIFFGGSIGAPWGLRFSPFMIFSSGQPYNLTVPDDLIGSSQFNQRPAFASASSNPANVVDTPLGDFDTVPQAGETLVPINYETGPNLFTMNLRVSKTFSFGKEGRGGAAPSGFGGGGGGGGRGGGSGGRGTGMVFGGGPGRGGQNTARGRYNLTFSVFGRNIFNDVNLAPPIGVIGNLTGRFNGLYGQAFSSGTAASRVIYVQTSFSF
ncbi:MAG: carboxypeptidase regulatory-like domain-containing protein [Candidatus Acidiferrales bacterium]